MDIHELMSKIARDLALESEDITADTELLLSGLLDSLAVVGLVEWIESTVRIDIDPVELVFENFETPKAVMAMVDRLAGSAGSAG